MLLDDFDEDGKLDLFDKSGQLSLGQGDGTFGAAMQVAFTGTRPRSASGDVDGDGHRDLVAAGSGPGTSSGTLVLLGNGAGGFHLQVDDSPVAGVASFPTAVAIGRFNADPYGDVLATRGVPDPLGGADIGGEARVFLGDDGGGLTSNRL